MLVPIDEKELERLYTLEAWAIEALTRGCLLSEDLEDLSDILRK